MQHREQTTLRFHSGKFGIYKHKDTTFYADKRISVLFESIALDLALNFLLVEQKLKIKHIIKDHDNKSANIMEKYGLAKSVLYDRNHVLKSIQKGLEALYKENMTDFRNDNKNWGKPDIRREIINKIIKRIKYCIDIEDNKPPDLDSILTVLYHLSNDHQSCGKKCQVKEEERKKYNSEVLDAEYPLRMTSGQDGRRTRELIDDYLRKEYNSRLSKVMKGRTTQSNERFNSLIARRASKSKSYRNIYSTRVSQAYLRWNGEEEKYYKQLCSDELSENIIDRLQKRKKRLPKKRRERIPEKSKKKRKEETTTNSPLEVGKHVVKGLGD